MQWTRVIEVQHSMRAVLQSQRFTATNHSKNRTTLFHPRSPAKANLVITVDPMLLTKLAQSLSNQSTDRRKSSTLSIVVHSLINKGCKYLHGGAVILREGNSHENTTNALRIFSSQYSFPLGHWRSRTISGTSNVCGSPVLLTEELF